MNAMTDVIVCADRIREKLIEDMRLIQTDNMRRTADEKVTALDALYTRHLYVEGDFSSSTGIFGGCEVFFVGRICDVAYSIHIL